MLQHLFKPVRNFWFHTINDVSLLWFTDVQCNLIVCAFCAVLRKQFPTEWLWLIGMSEIFCLMSAVTSLKWYISFKAGFKCWQAFFVRSVKWPSSLLHMHVIAPRSSFIMSHTLSLNSQWAGDMWHVFMAQLSHTSIDPLILFTSTWWEVSPNCKGKWEGLTWRVLL